MPYIMDARRRHPFDRGERPVPAELVAANDNVPQDESGQSAGFAVGEERGRYIGLSRTHETFQANVAKWRADDTPAYRQQQGLEALAELDGYVYLGSPYAKYPGGLAEAARIVAACAGQLMLRGLNIYCPIAHGHAVSGQAELPREWEFWKKQDQPLIDGAAAIIVLEMKGWYDSVGLNYEVSEFIKAGKPILYLEPGDLGVEEA